MTISGQYLTYSEYTALGGTLSEPSFNLLEFEARQIIDKYTFGRLKELITQNQEVKLCVYKLIGIVNAYTTLDNQKHGIASETIDGYSISYSSMDTAFIEAKNTELGNVVRDYLVDCKLDDGTPYLYCGAK